MGIVRQLAQQFESLGTRANSTKPTSTSTDNTNKAKLVLIPTPTHTTVTETKPTDTPIVQHSTTTDTKLDNKVIDSTTNNVPVINTSNTVLLTSPTAAHASRRSLSHSTIQHWTCNTLFNRLSNYSSLMCIDIRTATEYEQGHIPRALNIPLNTTLTKLTIADIEGVLQSITDKRMFKCRARHTVVVYSNNDTDTVLHTLCNTLLHENRILAAVVLTSGYTVYSQHYPYAICNNNNSVQSHMSLPAALDLEPQSPSLFNTSSTLTTPVTSPLRTQSHDASTPSTAIKQLNKHIHRSAFPWYPSEVIVHQLYLGSHTDASNLDILQQLQITHILNVSAEVDNLYPTHFTYSHIVLPDTIDSDITVYFEQSNQFISQCLQSHGRILVHCYQGVSRSSTLILAYLMYTLHCTLYDAYQLVLNARKQIMPNIGFWKQLGAYECSVLGTRQSTVAQCVDIGAMELESALKVQSNENEKHTVVTPGDVNNTTTVG